MMRKAERLHLSACPGAHRPATAVPGDPVRESWAGISPHTHTHTLFVSRSPGLCAPLPVISRPGVCQQRDGHQNHIWTLNTQMCCDVLMPACL